MPKKVTLSPMARKEKKKRLRQSSDDGDEKKMTNKDIAYAYIIRHMRSIRPNTVVITAIAGAKFRSGGSRLQRISDMILENAAKLMKRPKALLEKRGHEDAPFVTIDTSTKTAECDTSEDGVPSTTESED